MADIRGHVHFEVEGDKYTLHCTTNMMCNIEAERGEPFATFVGRFGDEAMSFSDIRFIFFHLLREHQAELTIEGAGGLMDRLGGIEPSAELLTQAIEAAMPDVDDAKPGKRKAKK